MRIELTTFSFAGKRSIPVSYGEIFVLPSIHAFIKNDEQILFVFHFAKYAYHQMFSSKIFCFKSLNATPLAV